MTSPLGILSADQLDDPALPCDWDSICHAAFTAVWQMPCNHPNERLLCEWHAMSARIADTQMAEWGGACWRCSECHVPGRLASLDPL